MNSKKRANSMFQSKKVDFLFQTRIAFSNIPYVMLCPS